mgnify:CR=1 FL=1
MKTNSKRWLQKASILKMAPFLAMAGVPYLATAQEAMKLEEVLVTATRRAQTDAQSTPVALTQISSEQIDNLVPRDLLDIAALAPNVSGGKNPGFNSANFAIRGVGQNGIIVYYENQVGVTVDDFVIPHIQTANIEMLDIEAIEILRGPQGTLFGKNTTGGVINVKTKKPQLGENTADVSAKLADFGRREFKGVFNFDLGDTLALRIAALQMKSDGIYELGASYDSIADFGVGHPDVGTSGAGSGEEYGGDDVFSGRLKLRWQPSDALDVNLTYEMVRDRGDAPPSINGTPDGEYVFNSLGFTRDSGNPFDRAAATGREDVLIGMDRGHVIDVDGVFLNVDWMLNDEYTLTTFAGQRETDSWLPSTYTGEPGLSLFDANRQDNRETSQIELRLATDYSGDFNWVAGAFYQDDDTVFSVAQVLGFVDLTLDATEVFGDGRFFNNNPQVLSNGQDASATAIYWDGTWDASDRLTLGAGVRYTKEKKSWVGRNQVFVPALEEGLTWQELGEPLAAADFERFSTGVVRDSETWKEPTYRLTGGYQFSDDLYGYVTYSHGFKSGVYNDQTGTGGNLIEPVQARPTDPETADSFEIGLRSEFLDNRVRMNVTAFSVVYDDSQQQLLATVEADRDGSGTIDEGETFQETRFFNAAKIEVSGLELEGAWLINDALTLTGSVGILDAEFDSFEADTTFDGTIDTDLSGNPVARAPELMWNVGLAYNIPLSEGTLDLALGVNYEDEAVYAYTSVPNTPDGVTDERTLVDLSATYTSYDDSWWVRLYGKNLTDEIYRIGELPVANLWVMSFYGEPRTIGIEGGMRFSW